MSKFNFFVGPSDKALFSIFENGHYAANQVYFYEPNSRISSIFIFKKIKHIHTFNLLQTKNTKKKIWNSDGLVFFVGPQNGQTTIIFSLSSVLIFKQTKEQFLLQVQPLKMYKKVLIADF